MWHAKMYNAYSYTSTSGKENASEIASYLLSLPESETSDRRITLSACAAICGNCVGEGGLNPWRWQDDDVLTYQQFINLPSGDTQHGYGLFGFTPARNYINAQNESEYLDYGYGPNFLDVQGLATDGLTQTMYMASTMTQSNWASANWVLGYYGNALSTIANFDNLQIYQIAHCDLETFKYGRLTTYWDENLELLTAAFMCHWEKPGAQAGVTTLLNARIPGAIYLYEYFNENPPAPFDPEIFGNESNWKFYLFL